MAYLDLLHWIEKKIGRKSRKWCFFVEDRVLKVKKVKDKYYIRMFEGDQLLGRGYIRSPEQWEEKFPELSRDIIDSWDDEQSQSRTFQLYNDQKRGEYFVIEDFGANSDDDFYQSLPTAIVKEKTKPKKVKEIKKANPKVIALVAGATFLSAAMIVASVSLVTRLKGKQGEQELKVSPIPYETEIEEETQEIPETIPENVPSEVEDNALPTEAAIEEEPEKEVRIQLYDQPLLPIDLNLCMHEVSLEFPEVPYRALITIAHIESRGAFNNSGVVVENKNGTRDVGYMQINSSNFEYLKEQLGYTEDQIIHDDKVNIRCAARLLQDFARSNQRRNNGETNLVELFGQYNGGSNYDQPSTQPYRMLALEALSEFYNEDHVIEVTPEGVVVESGVSK